MQDEFSNRSGMFRTVKGMLYQPEHLAVWDGQQPLAFGVHVGTFNAALSDLESFVSEHGQIITGAAADKARIKDDLLVVSHELGSVLAIWFRERKDETNAALVSRAISTWLRFRDAELLAQSQIVIDTGQAVVTGPDATAAADFGITPTALADLSSTRSLFVDAVAAPQQRVASRKALTAQYRPRFNVVDSHLRALDGLILPFRRSEAGRALVAAYQASRIVRDLGRRSSSKAEKSEPEAAAADAKTDAKSDEKSA